MPLIQLKCSSCGGIVDIDDEGNGICTFCGSKFIKEDKIINNYTINIIGNNNIAIGSTPSNTTTTRLSSSHLTGNPQNNQNSQAPELEFNFSDFTNLPVEKDKEITFISPVEEKQPKIKKGLRIALWFLCFPLPLTILFFKTKNLSKIAKIVILVFSWCIYSIIFNAFVPSRIPVISTLNKAEINEYGNYIIDYGDAQSFETDLNSGMNLKGKIVNFEITEYQPYSSLGKNMWSGEHLNFVVKKNPKVKSGDRITVIANRVFKFMDSWVINCEIVDNSDYSKDTKFYNTVNNTD